VDEAGRAVIEVSASETIDAPVDVVFEKMSRLETLPRWLVGCVEAWPLTDDPYRVGARIAHIDEVMGQRFEARYEVIGWEPNRCFTFRTLEGGPFEGTSDLTFAEEGRATRVEICIKGELKGVFRFGAWAARKVAQKQLDDSVANARDLIEAGEL